MEMSATKFMHGQKRFVNSAGLSKEKNTTGAGKTATNDAEIKNVTIFEEPKVPDKEAPP